MMTARRTLCRCTESLGTDDVAFNASARDTISRLSEVSSLLALGANTFNASARDTISRRHLEGLGPEFLPTFNASARDTISRDTLRSRLGRAVSIRLQCQRGGFRSARDQPEDPMKKTPKFKRSNSRAEHKLQSRVYKFGIPKIEGPALEILLNQARIATEYQRGLVQNEIDRRAEIDLARRRNFPAYDRAIKEEERLDAAIDDAYDRLRKERQKARKRVRPEAILDEIEERKSKRRTAWEVTKQARSEVEKAHAAAATALKDRIKEQIEAEGVNPKNTLERARIRCEVMAAMKEEVWPKSWLLEMKINTRASEREKELRAKATAEGLRSGVTELTREEVAAAKKHRRMRLPFGVEGRVGRELKEEEVRASISGSVSSKNFSLIPDPDAPTSNRKILRHRARAVIALGGDDKIEFPVFMHARKILDSSKQRGFRAEFLPDGARIKRVWILTRAVAGRLVHELQLTVQAESFGKRAPAKRATDVHVTLGWAAAGEAIRVCRWDGSDGQSGEVLLDERTNHAFLSCEAMRSAQDDIHNEAREALAKRDGEDWPTWLDDAIDGVAHWRNPKRLHDVVVRLTDEMLDREMLAELWREWKRVRLKGKAKKLDLWAGKATAIPELGRCARRLRINLTDEQMIVVWLEWWRRKNEHLRKFIAHQRVTAIRRRRDHYCCVAKQLAGKYETWSTGQSDDMLKWASRSTPETKKVDSPERTLTGQRRRAAPSELQAALIQAFGSKPRKVVEAEAE